MKIILKQKGKIWKEKSRTDPKNGKIKNEKSKLKQKEK